MITFTIWLILSVVIFGYLWFQWDKISLAINAIGFASKMIDSGMVKNQTVVNGHSKVKLIFLKFLGKFKKLMWIPICLILFLNYIVASVIGFFVNIILFFF